MSFREVALGLASLAVGINTLKKGFGHLSAARQGMSGAPVADCVRRGGRVYCRPRPNLGGGFMDAPAMPAPTRLPGRPFVSSGYRSVPTRNGTVPMQMRSYNIRTLDDRINYLRRLVDQGKRDPQVYAFARRAISKKCGNSWCTPEKDNLAEAKALFGALRGSSPQELAAIRKLFQDIRRNVRYTSDIAAVDTYQKPAHTLALGTADCDDYTTLACSSLGSIGIPCRFKVIRTKGSNDWNHIYAQAGLPRANPTRWYNLDASVNMPFGWEAPPSMVAASRVFRVG
jgi:transglutaminase-like putative cysteine protease